MDQAVTFITVSGGHALQQLADIPLPYTGSARARAWLNFFYGYDYWTDPYLPVETSMKTAYESTTQSIQQVEKLDVYPLPATQWVSFSYQMLATRTNIILEIIHPLGYAMYYSPLQQSAGVHVIETSAWKPGLYHYRIHANGEKVFTGHLIIQ